MYLVYEKDIVGFERSEHAGQVTGLVQHRTGGHLDIHSQLVGDDIGEGGLAQAGRTEEEHVVEGFATLLGRTHEDAKIVEHLLLPRKAVEALGAQSALDLAFLHGLAVAGSI